MNMFVQIWANKGRLSLLTALITLSGVTLTGCSDNTASSGISGSGAPVLVAGGPISGFGTASASDPSSGGNVGIGTDGSPDSMIINGENFTINQSDLSIDGTTANANEFQLGMQVVAESENQTADGSQQATSITADTDVQGTVTEVDTFSRSIRVLEQTVKITNETVTDQTNTSTLQVAVGEKVRVSGLRDSEKNILASRIEVIFEPTGLVSGRINSFDSVSKNFNIGNLQIVFDNSINPGNLRNGTKVQVTTSSSASAGSVIASEIRVLKSHTENGNGRKLKFQARIE